MAVTPNFNWPVPVATDYVKDGWEAISDLGNAIDTTVAGLGGDFVHLNTTTFTTAANAIVDNVFTSTYQNYKMFLNLTAASANDVDILWYGRTSGSDVTTNYTYQQLFIRSTTVSASSSTTGRFSNSQTGGATTTQHEILICSPQLAQITMTHTMYQSEVSSGAPYLFLNSTRHSGTNQFDGIKIYTSSGTMSGTLRIYGIANS